MCCAPFLKDRMIAIVTMIYVISPPWLDCGIQSCIQQS